MVRDTDYAGDKPAGWAVRIRGFGNSPVVTPTTALERVAGTYGASAASSPRPASTHVVIRSNASGRLLMIACCRCFARDRMIQNGIRNPSTLW